MRWTHYGPVELPTRCIRMYSHVFACIRMYSHVSRCILKTISPHVSNTCIAARGRYTPASESAKYMHDARAKKWRRGTTQYMPKRGQYTTMHKSGRNPTLNREEIRPPSVWSADLEPHFVRRSQQLPEGESPLVSRIGHVSVTFWHDVGRSARFWLFLAVTLSRTSGSMAEMLASSIA